MSGQRAHEQPKPQLVAPPVQREPYKYLIPPQSSKDHNKLVVVLDLDETLVYGREGPVRVRPGTAELLQCLKDRAEVIVWTAGSRDYALEVINIIDPFCAIQHCIYRHPMWWTGEIGCTKDLNQLGRPLEKTVLIDNTPDVFRANPTNGILVSDFLGTVFKADRVLFTLADIFDFIFRRISDPTVGSIFASKRIMLRRVPLESNRKIELYTLAADDVENHMYISPAQRSLLQYLH
ncbi:nuclear lim interactor-interacting factor [Angomonas deanei]|uniref:Mitochondrial import inner membrane translocase subunit TIM50 n=1 Tax=Angomonas deanei TaxID=59799 RepID=A0A7G2CGJ8_9TRYP|nr:nuclear lim interactor-interacting factor [Angomonas deanei]CAD2218629.1 NLI interacting factor-like phosphatase, putative [Angomonas deanei]|eukprot:EPY43005.1 nuclear lim interactor-interacting factor [Angomonas deanei]